ncbi:class I glutamine amidotransferase-like protein [Pluteus cervinus]|uniref:Class I glutamine amidotransferase-like protein n=1 Tax=Pluteus cervinus TaxID=181527 RepID=A0ACD3AEB6_9AGAR|nr:class I glutamine amidotransferase-like protein [Pluteus cervinus]
MTSPKSLQIGVMLEAVQLSDVIGIDILGSLSKTYIQSVVSSFPTDDSTIGPALLDLAPEITIHFISSTLEAAHATPGLRFLPTTTYASCPLDLDLVLIGGPLPDHRPPASIQFLKDVVSKGKDTTIMSVCTGGMWLADSGVLQGRKATAQREVLGLLKVQHPEVEWLDQRWVVDGNFWTAGGAGCGVDMIIAYIKERFDARLVGLVLQALQFGTDQGQLYKD